MQREGTLSETWGKPSRLTEKRVRHRPRLVRLSDAIKRVESTVELGMLVHRKKSQLVLLVTYELTRRQRGVEQKLAERKSA